MSGKTKKGDYLLMPKQVALTKTKTPEYHLPHALCRVKEKSGGGKKLESKKEGSQLLNRDPEGKNA